MVGHHFVCGYDVVGVAEPAQLFFYSEGLASEAAEVMDEHHNFGSVEMRSLTYIGEIFFQRILQKQYVAAAQLCRGFCYSGEIEEEVCGLEVCSVRVSPMLRNPSPSMICSTSLLALLPALVWLR